MKRLRRRMAGEHGFEPWNGGFKGPCLTTWRLPNGVNDANWGALPLLSRRSVRYGNRDCRSFILARYTSLHTVFFGLYWANPYILHVIAISHQKS